MREKIKKFPKSRRILFFLLTQKGIERFNESRFKSRKVKGRATSSENRKFFVAVMKDALGVVKKMLTNGQCALHYSNEKFSILARGRSSFHLSALEATFIKSLNPLLCKQKKKNSSTLWKFFNLFSHWLTSFNQ